MNNYTALLEGTDAETVSLSYSFDSQPAEYHCTKMDVHVSIPNLSPSQDHSFLTSTYSQPKLDALEKMLDGDSTQRFCVESLNFTLQVYEHKWGVRSGYIAELTISSIVDAKFAPWPDRRPIGNYILYPNPSAFCLNIAFQCDYEKLRAFYKEFRRFPNM